MPGVVLTGNPLLICEGREEQALANAFMRLRGLQTFDVDVIGDHGGGSGLGALRHHLPLLSNVPNFASVTRIALLVDCDEGYASAMNQIKTAIRLANANPLSTRQLPVPRSAYRKWRKGGLSLTVILQPGAKNPGCLETTIWQILSRLHGAEAVCVENSLGCAGINAGPNRWGVSKLDKARVRAGVALMYRRSPALPVTAFWTKPQHRNLVPILSPEFATIFNHLVAV